MLQQTQVKTVIPFWNRWMKELPTIEAAAKAPSAKIHKLWEGLGYYTRVRNLQKAAQQIVQGEKLKAERGNTGGQFPENFDEVLALPGIGRYTAGAICSIAFNQPKPILDGNVIRVLTRLLGIRENARERETNARLWELAQGLVAAAGEIANRRRLAIGDRLSSSSPCSALNQSLMELGALVCTPRQPKCGTCPLAKNCVAKRDNLTEEIPNLGARARTTARRFVACVVEHDGKFLVRQRPGGVVNAHLWEFPNVEIPVDTAVDRAQNLLESDLGCALSSIVPLVTIKHTITRYRIMLEVFRGEMNGAGLDARGEWVSRRLMDKLAFTSAHRRVLNQARAKAGDCNTAKFTS